MKKLPPFINDNIPEEDIVNFQKKGLIGWGFLTSQVLNISEDQIEEMRSLKDKIKMKKADSGVQRNL